MLVSLILVLLLSCELYYSSSIINISNKAIVCKIVYNKKVLEQHWNNISYLPFIKSEIDQAGGKVMFFDSINLIATIKLRPKDSLLIEGGIRRRPNFELIRELIIYSSDTLVINDKNSFRKNFSVRRNNGNSSDLIIN